MGLFNKKETTVVAATRRTETKIITFVGTEHGIIPYHFALSLRGSSTSDIAVLVIDNSRSQDLFDSVPHEGEVGNIDGIPVVRNRRYTKEPFSKFNFVVVYLGLNMDDEYVNISNNIFVLSDYTRISKRFLNTVVLPATTPCRFVFYNKTTNKVTENMMVTDMEHYTVSKDAEFMVCYLNEEDVSGYIIWLYNGYHRLSSMSKDYQQMISAMKTDITKANMTVSAEETDEDED